MLVLIIITRNNVADHVLFGEDQCIPTVLDRSDIYGNMRFHLPWMQYTIHLEK